MALKIQHGNFQIKDTYIDIDPPLPIILTIYVSDFTKDTGIMEMLEAVKEKEIQQVSRENEGKGNTENEEN